MSQNTPQQAWDSLATFWSQFDFMLEPGATAAEINAFEKDQDVTLLDETKQLISIHSTVGIPSGIPLTMCAETSLMPIDTWRRFDNSILNKQMDDPSFWPGVFKDYNLPSDSMEDYTVIGSNPWGADYGLYIMIYQSNNTVYSIDWNIPEIKPLGDMTDWLANYRLGDYKDVQAYVDDWNKESDDPGGAGIAKQNTFYLNIGYPEALKRWQKNEAQFIQVFDSIQ